MKRLFLSEIIRVLNLKFKGKDTAINYVGDSILKMNDNALVFHLDKAVEFDFEKFNRLKNCYVVTDQPLLTSMKVSENRIYYVDNVHKAYDKFIEYYRSLFIIPVIAVTGTVGKTTTKEIIAQILKHKHKVVHTYNSRNALRFNHDYLMQIDDETEYGVFETGITHPGDIITECHFFRPSIGIITKIGIDHLNGCGNLNNYIRAKAEMLTELNYMGVLIINNDDDNIRKIDFYRFYGKIITFGIKRNADFRAKNIIYSQKGMKFTLIHNNKQYRVFVPGYGEHNVMNALAALACLTMLGKDLEESIEYLKSFKHIRSHVEFHKGINGSTIIDDTWSSNPTSLESALKVLNARGKNKKKIAVIGKINYLGRYEGESYKKIGKMLVKYGVDYLITADKATRVICDSAIQEGMNKKNVIYLKDKKDVRKVLMDLLDNDSIVLFKISMLDQSLANHTFYNPPKLTVYKELANQTTKVFAQIETVSGLNNIEKILSVEGVYGAFVGPNDLSDELNCLDDKDSKLIKDAIEKVVFVANKLSKEAGIITTNRNYLNQASLVGMSYYSVGSELSIIINGFKAVVKTIDEL